MQTIIGMQPSVELSWDEITTGEGLPQRLDGAAGLYAILGGDELLYIGSSRSLGRRIGQAVGAICGAPGLHPGGRRIFITWDTISRPLRFLAFEGEMARVRERDAIVTLKPQMNVLHLRRGVAIAEVESEQ